MLDNIVSASKISEEDCVLEIGPGMGALTGRLIEHAKKVIAVEIDKMLIPILKETLQDSGKLVLINDDILKVDIEGLIETENEGAPIKVVANLPYYITTPIVLELLRREYNISSITIMVQKEVAERMMAGPGSKAYGSLSLAVQYYCRPNIEFIVSKNSFYPRPDVDSAVIKLDIYAAEDRPVRTDNTELLFKIIKAAFGQRRKMLANTLGCSADIDCSKDAVQDALRKMGLDEQIRGEALCLEQFAHLADLLSERV